MITPGDRPRTDAQTIDALRDAAGRRETINPSTLVPVEDGGEPIIADPPAPRQWVTSGATF